MAFSTSFGIKSHVSDVAQVLNSWKTEVSEKSVIAWVLPIILFSDLNDPNELMSMGWAQLRCFRLPYKTNKTHFTNSGLENTYGR